MKKILALVLTLAVISALSCDDSSDSSSKNDEISVQLSASLSAGAVRAVSVGGVTVEEYMVTFYKVEIGNSEDDKFTLWEDDNGAELNLASADEIVFDSLNTPVPGTYKFCRLTVDKTIHLKGSVLLFTGEADVDVNGNFSDDGERAVFLFGTEDTEAAELFLLAAEIVIEEGAELSFKVDVNDKVSYAGSIKLSAPVITFSAE